LRFADIQGYVSARSEQPGIRGRNISPSTIKKELNTLRAVWKWAIAIDALPNAPFPSQGLRYPKTDELPPFQTMEQIQKQTTGLDPKSPGFSNLWSCGSRALPEITCLILLNRQVQHAIVHVFCGPIRTKSFWNQN
jgi:site-specific recombinase XerD